MMTATQTLVEPAASASSPVPGRLRLQSLYQHRYFFRSLVGKEFKIRYAHSVLGLAWMVIEPLLLVATLTIVFTLLGRKGPDGLPFPLFFYAGLLPWNYFRASLVQGASAFTRDQGLMQKVAYPREISIFKELSIYFVDFALANIAFVVVLAVYRQAPCLEWLALPCLLLLQTCLSLGIMFGTASLNVYVRDIAILLKTAGTLLFWFTPVVFEYPFSGKTKILYYINPMAGILSAYRSILLHHQYPPLATLYCAFIAAPTALILGYLTFRRLEKNFVDVL